MSKIPDFTESEIKIINDILQERYGEVVETQQADHELKQQGVKNDK